MAERYRRDGYDVCEEPQEGSLPFELGTYRPDLIARRGDQALMVEIKSSTENKSFEQLRSVIDELKRHHGWQFVLITAKDLLTGLPDAGEEQFSWNDVDARIDRAQHLNKQGEYEAAYLILWIGLECALRFQARGTSLPVDRLEPGVTIRRLYSQGELSIPQFDTALTCQAIRNRIVHGFPSMDTKNAVTRLAALLREVVDQWRGPIRETE